MIYEVGSAQDGGPQREDEGELSFQRRVELDEKTARLTAEAGRFHFIDAVSSPAVFGRPCGFDLHVIARHGIDAAMDRHNILSAHFNIGKKGKAAASLCIES